jgi:isocitrate dehydrogenase
MIEKSVKVNKIAKKEQTVQKIKADSGSSVGMIMVQFEDSLCQRSEVQISIRSSYSEKIFYEKKKVDDLWAHYHGLHSQPSDTY